MLLASVLERVTLLVMVKKAQQMAESRIKKSPFVEMLTSSLKPVEINTIPTMANRPARDFFQFIFSLRIKMARNAVNIKDVLERTDAFDDVVNL